MPKSFFYAAFVLCCLCTVSLSHANVLQVTDIIDSVEYASGPPELLKLETEGRINARSLRAFGKLPDEFMTLALELRSSGMDILTADGDQLNQYIKDAESGEIDVSLEKLKNLRSFLQQRNYLTWEDVQVGQELGEGDLIRSVDGASLTLRNVFGGESVVSVSGILKLSPESLSFEWAELSELTEPAAPEPPDMVPDAGTLPPHHEKEAPTGHTPEGLTPRATEIYEYWANVFTSKSTLLQPAGEINVVEHPDGIELTVPLVDYSLEDDTASNNHFILSYEIDTQQYMSFTVHLPRNVWLHDERELPIGLLRFAGQDINGVWMDKLDDFDGPVVTKLDILLEQVEFFFDALTVEDDDQTRAIIDKIVIHSTMEESQKALWNGETSFQADNLRIIMPDLQIPARIGTIKWDANVQDRDLQTTSAMFTRLLESLDQTDDAAFFTMLQQNLSAYGDAEFILAVSDITVDDFEDLDYLRLDSLQAKGNIQKSTVNPDARILNVDYHFKNLEMKADDSDINIDTLSFEAGLTDLDLRKAIQLANFDFFSDSNPFSSFEKLLSGVHFGFSVTGIHGKLEDLDFSGLEEIAVRFSISDLQTTSPGLLLFYNHKGLKEADTVPDELTPENLTINFQLTQIPIFKLATTGLLSGEDSMPLILNLLSEYDSSFNLHELAVTVPDSSMNVSGKAYMGAQEVDSASEIPVLQFDALLDISGIDALASSLSLLMDNEEEIKHLEAIIAFIKIASEERLEDDGSIIHYLNIQGNNLGEVTANGKDLTPILRLGAAQ